MVEDRSHLTVPIALGDKLKVAVDLLGTLDCTRPELTLSLLLTKGREAATPSLLEDVLADEHGHVATHSICIMVWGLGFGVWG